MDWGQFIIVVRAHKPFLPRHQLDSGAANVIRESVVDELPFRKFVDGDEMGIQHQLAEPGVLGVLKVDSQDLCVSERNQNKGKVY